MSLIIDGYNLLHEAGILGKGIGPGSLERSRLALLNFLAESLSPREINRTTVVFDAKEAPWGAACELEHRGIAVRFASRWPDADCLIEELILRNSSPRRLTVVSSDHRLQRSARRRKAKAVDSGDWYLSLVHKRLARRQSEPAAPERPPVPLLAEDVEYWVGQFGGESELEKWLHSESAQTAGKPAETNHCEEDVLPADRENHREKDDSKNDRTIRQEGSLKKDRKKRTKDFFKDDQPLDSLNPFPPGYAEDLEKEL